MKLPHDRLFLYRTDTDDNKRPGSFARGKDGTVRELLRLIRRHSPLSRADLVRLSGFTAPTVSAAIAKLQRKHLVVPIGPGSSNGGRPPGLLEFNARHQYVIGCDIGGSSVRLALADLNGTIVGRWNSALRADRSPKAVAEMIAAAVMQLTRQHNIPTKKVLELVAGAPGITDVIGGRVLSAPNLTGWHDVPFRDLLERELRIPTIVENDVNLGALGETWKGAARGTANFVFLAIGTGVGSGIVLNHMLHHGANWSAGEVGYLLLPNLSSDPPTKDGLGALESEVGGKSIERAWANLAGSHESEKPLRATEVFDRAVLGDQKGRALLQHVADQLAMAITNLSLVLDLSLVVLGGGVGGHAALLQAIQRRLERNEIARPQVVLSSLGGEAQIHGAIWLGLQAAQGSGFSRRALANSSARHEQLVAAADESF
jgi:glucokinase